MVRSLRCSPAILLLPAAVLAGHGLGYLLAGSGHHGSHAVGHGYLDVVVAMALPALVAALVWTAVRAGESGRRRPRAPSLGALVAGQWALFVVQETVEHAVAGDPAGMMASPAIWLGLLSQVAIAAATRVVLSVASWTGGRAFLVLAGARGWLPPARGWLVAPVPAPATGGAVATVSSRGPPHRRR